MGDPSMLNWMKAPEDHRQTMSSESEEQKRIIEKLRARVARLEYLLGTHHIPVPPEDEAGGIPADSHLAFPELDFSEPERKPAEKIDTRAALEEFPHIAAALTGLWGRDGFEEYLGKLIVDERGNRKGFSMDAMEELLLLARVARQRKAYFGFGADGKPGDIWTEIREVSRRAASAT